MYLKRMELIGFKSFASKTKIDFESGISCIVGPNGSGKSNVADALRWVLGEQNTRNIRGGKLEDVIFSGTGKRRPLSMAEVTIILDNSDGRLNLPTSEVSITRRAIRGGGSDYLINNKVCRLKDVHDLFVDTGVSVDGLSIINQGRINELINARPDERRALVEEAAGIIKYRDRKREAVRRLAETERHLETIGAIVAELYDRLEPLKVQAQKAEKYLELKEEADRLEIGLSVKVLTEIKDKISHLDDTLAESKRRLLEEDVKRLTLSAETEQLRLTINELDETVSRASQQFYQLQSAREKAEGELALGRSAKENADANIQRLQTELAGLEQALCSKQEEIQQLSAHIERTRSEISRDEENILSGQGGEEDIRSQSGLLSDKLSQLQKDLNDITADSAAAVGQLDFTEQLLAKNREELVAVEAQQLQIADDIREADARSTSLHKRQDELKELIRRQTAAVNEQELELRKLNKELEDTAACEADKRYQVSSAKTRVTMLEDMAADYEGFFPGVRGLMSADRRSKAPEGIIGVISELMDVPEKYRAAIETYLGANLQNVVTANTESAKACVAYLKKNELGRATFLPLDALKVRPAADISSVSGMKGVAGLAIDLVDCQPDIRPAVDFLLNNLLIADKMDDAVRAARSLKYRVSVATLDGDIVHPGASISGGSRNKKTPDLLGKKSRLQEAKKALAESEKELSVFEEKTASLRKQVGKSYDMSDELQTQLQRLSRESFDVEQELARLTFTSNESKKQSADLAIRKEALNKQSLQLEADLAELQSDCSRNYEAKKQIEDSICAVSEDLAELQRQISGHQDELTERKMNLASSRQKLRGQTLTLERLNDEHNNLSWEAEEKSADLESAAGIAAECTEKINAAEQTLQSLAVQLHDSGAELEKMRHGLSAETDRLRELEKQERECFRQKESFQAEVHQLELKREHWLADYDNEAAKLAEKFDLTLDAAVIRAGEISLSRGSMNNRLSQLRREISSLGEVNTAAINEYDEVSERYDFLSGQRDDMINARAKLDKVISEMDSIMSRRFRDAYTRLSKAFDESFTRLFGGGSAGLYLSSPDDILDTGVEIRVDPPGKKVANYNLLSGGEKSLVGIALLFAMLKVRPTPFCVMDEVDAALDEANIGRFTDFLQEEANNSQFVMITHRQRTMEAASSMWGVTMEEEGVSMVLSVKMDQYS